jgi:hypothetical protein
MEKRKEYEGLFGVPATDGNFLSGLSRLNDDDLIAFSGELLTRERDEHCHKGRINAVAKEMRSRKKKPLPAISVEVRAMDLAAKNKSENLSVVNGVFEAYGVLGKEYEHLLYVQTAKNMFELHQAAGVIAGAILLAIKENEPHGGFLKALEHIGINYRKAYRYMHVAQRFGKFDKLSNLNNSKLEFLELFSDPELEDLNSGKDVNGLNLRAVEQMTRRQLEDWAEKKNEELKKEKEARKKDRDKLHELEDELDNVHSDRPVTSREEKAQREINGRLGEYRKILGAAVTGLHDALNFLREVEKVDGVTVPMLQNWTVQTGDLMQGLNYAVEELAGDFDHPHAGEVLPSEVGGINLGEL